MLEVIWTFSPFHAWNEKLLWSNLKKNTRFNESWIKAFLNPILSYRQFTCIAFIWTAVWARSQSSSRWILESIGGSFCYRFITYYGTNFKSKPTCVWLCSLKVAFSILQVMWCLWFHDSLQTREKHIGVLFMRGERRSQKSHSSYFPALIYGHELRKRRNKIADSLKSQKWHHSRRESQWELKLLLTNLWVDSKHIRSY